MPGAARLLCSSGAQQAKPDLPPGHRRIRADRRQARSAPAVERRASSRRELGSRNDDSEGPCGVLSNTQLVPEAANLALIRAAVLCLVNRERAQNGESPLILNSQLEKAAEGHNHEMIAEDYFAHVSPTGVTPVQRIQSTTGYLPGSRVGYVIGENLAWGTLYLATPQAIVDAWIASPGHLANILEARYRETGIGVVPSVTPAHAAGGRSGATYAQEFGVISAERRAGITASGIVAARVRYPARTRERRWSVTLSDSFCGTLEVTGR